MLSYEVFLISYHFNARSSLHILSLHSSSGFCLGHLYQPNHRHERERSKLAKHHFLLGRHKASSWYIWRRHLDIYRQRRDMDEPNHRYERE